MTRISFFFNTDYDHRPLDYNKQIHRRRLLIHFRFLHFQKYHFQIYYLENDFLDNSHNFEQIFDFYTFKNHTFESVWVSAHGRSGVVILT